VGCAASPRTLAVCALEHPVANTAAHTRNWARQLSPRGKSRFRMVFRRTLSGNPPSYSFDATREPMVSADVQTQRLYQRGERIYITDSFMASAGGFEDAKGHPT